MITNMPFNYNVYTKKNKLYVVIDYKGADGCRKKKWIATGLDAGAKKKEISAATEKIVTDYLASITVENNVTADNKTETFSEISVVTESRNNVECSDEKIDLLEFMDKWLEYKKPRVAKKTYQNYCNNVKVLKGFLRDKKLCVQSVKPIDIQELDSLILKSGVKKSTLKVYHTVMHNILEYAIKLDLILFNPTSRVELPKVEGHEATFYSKSELDELF